jgi:hypothetical protein
MGDGFAVALSSPRVIIMILFAVGLYLYQTKILSWCLHKIVPQLMNRILRANREVAIQARLEAPGPVNGEQLPPVQAVQDDDAGLRQRIVRDPNEDAQPVLGAEIDEAPAVPPIHRSGLLVNLEKFVLGLFASLFPSWQVHRVAGQLPQAD